MQRMMSVEQMKHSILAAEFKNLSFKSIVSTTVVCLVCTLGQTIQPQANYSSIVQGKQSLNQESNLGKFVSSPKEVNSNGFSTLSHFNPDNTEIEYYISKDAPDNNPNPPSSSAG